MNEVDKMYENCNIKKIRYCEVEDECPFMFGHRCEDCDLKPKPEYYIYPPFTAEKRLSLIKWLVQNKRLCVRKAEYSNNFYMDTIINRSNGVDSKNFEVCLASLVNNLWQSLTDVERKQIRGILESEVRE